MSKIISFHLLNDYSGSPKVLKMVLDGFVENGNEVDIITSNGGVLDELSSQKNIKIFHIPYKFSNNTIVTMLRYILVQITTFFFAFRWFFCENIVFYINTILPIGPALAGRLMGKKVIYHYHENADSKGAFYKILAWFMQILANKIICVSMYQASLLKRKMGVFVIPNALPNDFISKLNPNISEAFKRKQILMLGSLKFYKGTNEFCKLAKLMPKFKFELVLNESQENIDSYWESNKIEKIENLVVYPRQKEVAPFYSRASIVLNLSNKELFVETFGLTVLEAFSAGVPVIVPTVGGIAELVTNDKNGYKIDSSELNNITDRINELLSNKKLYENISNEALKTSYLYSYDKMITQIINII